MSKILALVPHLNYGSTITQLTQLAAGLPGAGHSVRVVALTGSGPVEQRLRQAAVSVQCLSRQQHWNLTAPLQLRHLLQTERPDLIHVWGLPTLRILFCAGGFARAPVVLSQPVAADRAEQGIGWPDRWLIRRCQRVVVADAVEADQCRAAGIATAKLEVVAPGVAADTEKDSEMARPSAEPPVILCVGPVKRHKGFYDAIFALDLLRYGWGEIQLWIVGEGPDVDRLRRFAQITDLGQAVRFWGACEDTRPFLQRATAIWVPSHTTTGRRIVLEALAAGRPVVASRLPGLTELIADGETGFLIPRGQTFGFAKKTKPFLDDPAFGEQMGLAGRQFVVERHNSTQTLAQYVQLYDQVAA